MPDPLEPNRTVPATQDSNASAASSADETESPAHAGSAKPKFGAPAVPGEVGTLGPYRVVKQLGAGGMGAVYLAVDTRLDRKLALKVMLPEFAADRDAKERFLREARAAAKISHDNVVIVHEADERQGVPYIAMQFLQGTPLDEYLKHKGVPALPHVIRIAREAAAGLAAAHALGLVHRDIKPANLWLEAPNGRVKVLDFGLAKPVGTDAELTRSGAVVGTPAYMSPEQARGQKVDHRTDLFSLGAVLYRLCTGRTPFTGNDEPAPVRELNPGVPEPLAHQLLAKKPEDRPQTANEVARRLRAIAEQLLAPTPSARADVPPANAADLSVSQPVVVHPVPHQPPIVVPMQITAQPEDVFAHLEDDGPGEATESEPTAGPKPERAKGGRRSG
jgi:serine/threonine protein kinase